MWSNTTPLRVERRPQGNGSGAVKLEKLHTWSHMSCDMLRTSERSLANRTFMVSAHCVKRWVEEVWCWAGRRRRQDERDGDGSLCLYLGIVGSLHHFRLFHPVWAVIPAPLRKKIPWIYSFDTNNAVKIIIICPQLPYMSKKIKKSMTGNWQKIYCPDDAWYLF